ncbi:MAG: TfoX/Sxy family protein [Clostridia bacterium]|nr:TfoX/Sxy family protein [Clostridia bacterium]
MASSKEYRDYIIEQAGLDGITHRPMMGEYLLYFKGILFGGIYDNRLLVKITAENGKFNMEKQLPYDGAKEMYMVDDTENADRLKDIILTTCKGLK